MNSTEQQVPGPMVLIDQPDDGYAETQGWVEATVSEDEARDWLKEFCCDEDGEMGFRPTGPVKRVRLASDGREDEYERWTLAEDGDESAVEFWEVIVA